MLDYRLNPRSPTIPSWFTQYKEGKSNTSDNRESEDEDEDEGEKVYRPMMLYSNHKAIKSKVNNESQ